jgi:hypothetical protein
MSTKSLILLNLLSALGAEDPAPKAAGSFLKEKQFDVAELFAPLRKAAQVNTLETSGEDEIFPL